MMKIGKTELPKRNLKVFFGNPLMFRRNFKEFRGNFKELQGNFKEFRGNFKEFRENSMSFEETSRSFEKTSRSFEKTSRSFLISSLVCVKIARDCVSEALVCQKTPCSHDKTAGCFVAKALFGQFSLFNRGRKAGIAASIRARDEGGAPIGGSLPPLSA